VKVWILLWVPLSGFLVVLFIIGIIGLVVVFCLWEVYEPPLNWLSGLYYFVSRNYGSVADIDELDQYDSDCNGIVGFIRIDYCMCNGESNG
jgi:hypothetical protein